MRHAGAARHPASGQALVVFAILLVGLLGMVSVGVDGSYLLAQRRAQQSAADLAALAGVSLLPGSATDAKATAQAFAQKNGYTNEDLDGNGTDDDPTSGDGTVVTAVSPYGGDSGKIEVTIRRPIPLFFLPVLGRGTIGVKARAVAKYEQGAGYAIFVGHNDCGQTGYPESAKALEWSGSNVTITGDVHSNSWFKWNGSNNTINGDATYKCTLDNSGSGNTATSGPTDTGGTAPWPVTYTAASFGPCTYSGPANADFDLNADGPWWTDNASKTTLKTGVYCANNGTLKLSPAYISSQAPGVAFVATGPNGKVEISGSNFILAALPNPGVLAYAEAATPDAIKISGSGGSWTGTIYAYNGQVNVTGSTLFSVTGSILANTVYLSGGNWNLTGTLSGEARQRLIE